MKTLISSSVGGPKPETVKALTARIEAAQYQVAKYTARVKVLREKLAKAKARARIAAGKSK